MKYDLRAAEVTLLRRALVMYCGEYFAMKHAAKDQASKDEHQRYIDVAGVLSEKLLKEGVPDDR